MKTPFALLAVVSLVLLPRSVMAQAAQDSPSSRRGEARPARPMVEMYQKLHADMQASDAQLDALLAEMNGSTGEKKAEAMAALLNRLVQERKTSERRMAGLQMQLMRDSMAETSDNAKSLSDVAMANDQQQRLAAERAELEQQRAAAQRDAERAALQSLQDVQKAAAEAREQAERAAEARQQVAKALAERDSARQQAERAIAEARKEAEQAAVAREQALRAAERAAAERADAEQRARRDAEKKLDEGDRRKP